MDVMAGVNCDGSIWVNLGRSEDSKSGLSVEAEASIVDMVRAVVDEEGQEMLLLLEVPRVESGEAAA